MPFLHSVGGHQNVVDSLAFSPDGNLLLSGSWDGTARLWDFASGKLLRTFAWGSERIQCVAWSPDGRFVAVGGESPAIQPGEEYLQRYQYWLGHPKPRPAGEYWPDAPYDPSTVRVFDVETGVQHLKIEDYDRGISFSPDGQSIVVSSYVGLAIFELVSEEQLAVHSNEQGGFNRVGYSRDGKQIAAVNGAGVWLFGSTTLNLLEVVTADGLFAAEDLAEISPKFIRKIDYEGTADIDRQPLLLAQFCRDRFSDFTNLEISRSSSELPSLVMSPGNDRFAVISDQRRICVVDGNLKAVSELHAAGRTWIRTTAFSSDGRQLASTGDDRRITVWDVESGERVRQFGDPPAEMTSTAISESGRLAAGEDDSGRIVLIDADQVKVVATTQTPVAVVQLEFIPNSSLLLAAFVCGTVRILETPSLAERMTLECVGPKLIGGMATTDGLRYLAVSERERDTWGDPGPRRVLTVHSIQDGKLLQTISLPDGRRIRSTTTSQDRRRLGIACDNEFFQILAENYVAIEYHLQSDLEPYHETAFLPDERRVLAANDGYGIGIVELNSMICTNRFVATRDGPTSLAVSPDGRWLARSTAYWEQIEIFDLPSGILKRRLIGHQAAVNKVAFLPDSRRLVSAGRDGTLKIWDVESSTCLASFAWTGNGWECLTCENVPVEIGPDDSPASPDRS